MKDQLISASAFFSPQFCRNICWAHFFKKRIIEDNGLKFSELLAYSEDKEFVYKAVLLSKQIQISAIAEYFYRFNNNSAINKKRDYLKCRSDLIVMKNMFTFLSTLNLDVSPSVNFFLFRSLSRAFVFSLTTCKSIFEYREFIRQDLRYIIDHPLFPTLSVFKVLLFKVCFVFPKSTITMLKFRLAVTGFVKKRILTI